uniref:Solute carrier family 26 member 4 n=1 Tax=Sinocyclocheilus grahami TaxID=75366 RepID=A0A672NK92_SINGR
MMDEFFHENDYHVSRRIYSNRVFDQFHERQAQEIQSLRERLSRTCGCTDKWAVQKIKGLLPILDWLPKYPVKQWLPGDVVSGVTTGLVCCLQGVAYALLASVAPVYGLYSAFFPILTYFVLGTSRHISVGRSMALLKNEFLVVSNKQRFKKDLEAQRILVACTMTVLVGLFQVAMGLMKVGFLVRYLSDPLVGGFTTAAAFHVFISQIKTILSVPIYNHNGFFSFAYVSRNINQTNIADLIAGLLTIFIVMAVKEINTKFQHKIPVPIPIEVIVTVIASAISHVMDLNSLYGASIVHSLPRGFAPPQTPNIALIGNILGSSFSTAVVGYAVAVSVAKVYAAKHDYTVDGNQELIAFGVSNIFGGCFSSFVASTALSRTAVQESTGGKSQVAGLLSAIIVLVVISGIGFLLEPLPKSVLGAVVIVNLKGMLMQVVTVPYLWKKDRPDCIVWVGTCLAAIFLGLDLGLAVGLGLELLTVVFRIYEPEGVKIFRIPSPIFFANIDFFRDKLKDAVGFNPLRILRKRNKAVKKMKKLIKKGELTLTSVRLKHDNNKLKDYDESNMEDLDKPTDYSDLPVQVNWNVELPANIRVPPVNIHSLILDFSVVSFLDISALKGLKAVWQLFYIVGSDPYIIEKLRNCTFFDDEIKTSIFFLTIHDAMLCIHESHPPKTVSEKVTKTFGDCTSFICSFKDEFVAFI